MNWTLRATLPWLLLPLLALAEQPRRSDELAADGPLKVEVVAFADLTDAKRAGRKVPIKVHAPADGGPYPLVVFSHGAGGDWDVHHAQARHLASHGFVVLCLEHVGSNRERMTKGLRLAQNLDAMIHDADEVLAGGWASSVAGKAAQTMASRRMERDASHGDLTLSKPPRVASFLR